MEKISESAQYYITELLIAEAKSIGLEQLNKYVRDNNLKEAFPEIQERIANEIADCKSREKRYRENVLSCEEHEGFKDRELMKKFVEISRGSFSKLNEACEDPEEKALKKIDERNRDMIANPDSYFEQDDPRRNY